MKRYKVAILVYDDVEVLDFAGPFEVFGVTAEQNDGRFFDVTTVAPHAGTVTALNGLKVVPDHSLDDAPQPDLLVIPGGSGSKRLLENETVLAWVSSVAESAEVVMSVCSGARLLAKLGMLDGLDATTHHQVATQIRCLAPTARIDLERRYVDTGRIVTTGGISAGIDGSLHLVARLCGEAIAERTAQYMEYEWTRDAA